MEILCYAMDAMVVDAFILLEQILLLRVFTGRISHKKKDKT